MQGALGVWRWGRPPQGWLSGDGGSGEAPGWAWGGQIHGTQPRHVSPGWGKRLPARPRGPSLGSSCVPASPVRCPSNHSAASKPALVPASPVWCSSNSRAMSQQNECCVPPSPVPCPIKPSTMSQQAQCRVLTSPAPYPSNPSTASQQAQDGAPENPVSCPSKPNAMSQQYQCRVLTSQREGDPSYPQCWGGDGGAPAQAPVAMGGDLPAGGWEPRCPTPASPRCWQLPAPLPPRRGG